MSTVRGPIAPSFQQFKLTPVLDFMRNILIKNLSFLRIGRIFKSFALNLFETHVFNPKSHPWDVSLDGILHVWTHKAHSNSMQSLTLGDMALRPAGNHQGFPVTCQRQCQCQCNSNVHFNVNVNVLLISDTQWMWYHTECYIQRGESRRWSS